MGLLLVALAVVAQATLIARVRFLGACPNLLLVIIVSWGLLRGVSAALPIAFVSGLGLDLLSGLPLGTSALGLMAASLVAGLGTNQVFASNLALPALMAAAATLVYAFVVLLTLQFRGLAVDWINTGLQVVAPELVLNVLLILLVYPIMRRLTGARQ
jgi:rod shape-determining protein MreD